MYRNIERKIREWDLNFNKKPLVIIGVRQSGKSYIIEKYCKNYYKNYIKIDLLKNQDFINIYNSCDNYEKRKQLLLHTYKINFDDPNTILFVDEAQKCPLFIQDLKPFCEDGIKNIIVAGSLLNITLRDMNESYPVGRTHLENLYPMNFEEYLYATNNERFIPSIKESFIKNTPCIFHETLMELYYRYMFLGGMPELLQNYIDNDMDISKVDYTIIKDIEREYSTDITKHVKDEKEKLRIKSIYNNIESQLLKENPKFMYAKLDINDRKKDYIFALDWLVTSRMVIKCNQLTNPVYPIKAYSDESNYKLFLSDVGLLRNKVGIEAIDILLDGDYSYKGVLTENYVALELLNQFESIYYWSKKGNENNAKAEVDFVIQVGQKVIPIETKSSNNQSKSLNVYNELFHPELMIKISNANFGIKDNLKTIPLYATFLIKECLEDNVN